MESPDADELATVFELHELQLIEQSIDALDRSAEGYRDAAQYRAAGNEEACGRAALEAYSFGTLADQLEQRAAMIRRLLPVTLEPPHAA